MHKLHTKKAVNYISQNNNHCILKQEENIRVTPAT